VLLPSSLSTSIVNGSGQSSAVVELLLLLFEDDRYRLSVVGSLFPEEEIMHNGRRSTKEKKLVYMLYAFESKSLEGGTGDCCCADTDGDDDDDDMDCC